MAIKDIFKISRKTFFDPTAWFGDALFVNIKVSWNAMRDLFTSQKEVKSETFAEAQTRLNLTDEQIQERGQYCLLFSLIFVLCTLIAIAYGVFLLIDAKSIHGFVLSLVVAALLGTQAFRYHFWFFQIKYRKLGCTFQDWRQGKPSDREPKL